MLFVGLVLSSCGVDSGTTGDNSCYSNGSALTLMHDDIEREYLLYLPDSYDPGTPAPVVLNFHGFGDQASTYLLSADMRPVADTAGCILVYPQGSCSNGASHWNPCPIGGDNKSTADDAGFVEALLNEIASQYQVDMDRIYAIGYSNGGMMAYGLAQYKSELIAAVASVSGAMLDCRGSISHPMPVLHLHGTSDGVIPYNGNSAYSSVQEVLDFWVNVNQTNTTPAVSTDTSGTRTIEQYVYDEGERGVSVAHYKYLGGDHVWFGERFQGLSTASLIWEFLSRYDLNGLR